MTYIKNTLRGATMLAIGATVMAPTAMAEIPSSLTRDDVVEIVKEYISNNTGEVLDMIDSHIAEERASERESSWNNYMTLALENKDRLLNEERATVLGNPDSDVTLVYFQDFNCGHCKSMHDAVETALADEDVKIVNRYLPILGESSHEASTFALVVNEVAPEYLHPLHDAFFSNRESLTSESIRDFMNEVLDRDTVLAVAEYIEDQDHLDKIQGTIDYNLELAQDLEVTGTPFFAFFTEDNHVVVPGAIDKESFVDTIHRLRGEE